MDLKNILNKDLSQKLSESESVNKPSFFHEPKKSPQLEKKPCKLSSINQIVNNDDDDTNSNSKFSSNSVSSSSPSATSVPSVNTQPKIPKKGGIASLLNESKEGYKDRGQNEHLLTPEELARLQGTHDSSNTNNTNSNLDQDCPPPKFVKFQKGDPGIPPKSTNVPIWAQEWPPYQEQLESLKISDPEKYKLKKQHNDTPYPKSSSRRHSRSQNPNQHHHSSISLPLMPSPFGLHSASQPPKNVSRVPYSLGGIPQYDDIVRRVSIWLYTMLERISLDTSITNTNTSPNSNTNTTPADTLSHVEVDIKLGTLRFPPHFPNYLSSETLLNRKALGRNNSPKFVPTVSEELVKKIIDKIEEFKDISENGYGTEEFENQKNQKVNRRKKTSDEDSDDEESESEEDEDGGQYGGNINNVRKDNVKRPTFASPTTSSTIDVIYPNKADRICISYNLPDETSNGHINGKSNENGNKNAENTNYSPQAQLTKLARAICEGNTSNEHYQPVSKSIQRLCDNQMVLTTKGLDFGITIATKVKQDTKQGEGDSGAKEPNGGLSNEQVGELFMRKIAKTCYDVGSFTIDVYAAQPLNKDGVLGLVTREVELRIKNEAIIEAYQLAKKGDGEVLEELIGFWINSARELIRKVS